MIAKRMRVLLGFVAAAVIALVPLHNVRAQSSHQGEMTPPDVSLQHGGSPGCVPAGKDGTPKCPVKKKKKKHHKVITEDDPRYMENYPSHVQPTTPHQQRPDEGQGYYPYPPPSEDGPNPDHPPQTYMPPPGSPY